MPYYNIASDTNRVKYRTLLTCNYSGTI